MVTEWFINFELPIAYGLSSAFPLIGDFINGLITPRIYKSSGNELGAPYMMGFVI